MSIVWCVFRVSLSYVWLAILIISDTPLGSIRIINTIDAANTILLAFLQRSKVQLRSYVCMQPAGLMTIPTPNMWKLHSGWVCWFVILGPTSSHLGAGNSNEQGNPVNVVSFLITPCFSQSFSVIKALNLSLKFMLQNKPQSINQRSWNSHCYFASME